MLQHTLHEYVELVIKDYFQHLEGTPPSNVYLMVISEVEKALLKSVLDHVEHNQSKAALVLGISRGTLRSKLKAYDLDTHRGE